MYLGTIVVGIFSIIFLLYTNSFLIKRRHKEIGLYNILGMSKRHIAVVLYGRRCIPAWSPSLAAFCWGFFCPSCCSCCFTKFCSLPCSLVFR
ncbi:MAG: FtsX-like permease family protein [Evtepia gabavorous]